MDTKAYARENLPADSTAVGFTVATMDIERPDEVQFQIEVAQMRFTLNGTTPTSTVGIIGNVGDFITIKGESDVRNFRAIRTTGVAAQLQTIFFVKT